MPQVPVAYSFDGLQIEDPQALLRLANQRNLPTNLWVGKANRFILPKGKNPGKGWILMKQSILGQLDLDATNHFLRFEQGGSDAQEIVLKDLTIIQADAIYAAGLITDETLYLVELADKRHLFFMSAVNRDYNVRSPDGNTFFDDSLNSGAEWTWQEVLDDLFALLPDIKKAIPGVTAPTLFLDPANDFLLTTNPENLRFRGVSAWEAINHILDRLNFSAILNLDGELTYNPEWDDFSDTFIAGAKTVLDKAVTDSKALDISLSQEGTVPRIPETVRVFFPSREPIAAGGEKFLLEKSAETVDTLATTILPDAKPSKGTILVIWDELEAIFDESGAIQNQAALNTRGLEVATAHLQSDPSETADSRLYIGLLNVLPGTFAAFVAWGDIGSGLVTETGQVIPSAITDREIEVLTPMINEVSDPCGDLLAGWRPNKTADADDQACAGTVDPLPILTSDDVPYGPTNVVERAEGFANRIAWRFIGGAKNSSTLWVDDSPDFIDLTKDFTLILEWNAATDVDTPTVVVNHLLDIRGGVIVKLVEVGNGLVIDLFDGTSTTSFTFAGISAFLVDVWYVVYLRWNQSTRVMTVNAMAVETDLAPTANEDISALANNIALPNTAGIFVSGASNGGALAVGMDGRIDVLAFYQNRFLDCELAGHYNCGRLSTLSAPNKFLTGPAGNHRGDFQGFKITTDAVATNLIEIPIADDISVGVHAQISAFRTDAPPGAGSFEIMAGFKRSAGGVAVLVGTTLVGSVHDIGGTTGVGAAVSGNSGFITVTGRASRTINWTGEANWKASL